MSILWLYNFYFMQPGCNCLSVSETCLQSWMTKSSLDETQYTADVSLFTHFGLDKSNLMWNKLSWHTDFESFSKPHFIPHHLVEGTKSYPRTLKMLPCIYLTFRRVQRSFRGNWSAKKVHLWSEQLGTKVSFSDNVPPQAISAIQMNTVSLIFFFLVFNKWSSLCGVLSQTSMRNIVQSLIHLLVSGLNVWYFLI